MTFGSAKHGKRRLKSAKKKSVTPEGSEYLFDKLHDYQRQAIEFMITRGAAGLFLDPGLGKTICTLATYDTLRNIDIIDTMFVIAPLRPAHSVWPKEVEKWGLMYDIHVLHGKEKKELKKGKKGIYVINYEGLSWLNTQLSNSTFRKKFGAMMLVLDESSKVKNTRTQRFKILKNMLDWFDRRYILTGTPTPNSLIDIFGQIYVLDQGHALGRYITHFRKKYFFQSGYGGYTWSLLDGADMQIQQKIKPYVLRLDRSLLNLPPIKDVDIMIDLPEEAQAIYKEMEDDLVAMIKKNEVIAVNAAAASAKCRQIANGGVYTGEGKNRKTIHVHDAKTEAVLDIIQELGGKPVLIAYEFNHDLERLKKALGKKVPYIGSGVSNAKADSLIDKWNAGELPVLLGQPQSVAHGLNIQHGGHNIIWYGLTWNLENYEQFYQRVWRQGQKNTVMNYRIIVRNTVDEIIVKTLQGKSHTQGALLKALKRRYK